MRTVSDASPDAAQIFRLVETELREVEERLKSEAATSLPLVEEINRYLHDSGGKRVRPALLLLSSKLCGAAPESALQLGVVVELIHVATLVHDDIIDNASVRRGRASINARWGNNVTVLFGDWLYMTAFWVALKERKFAVLDVLIDVTRKMVEGELLQLERNHRLDTSVEDYLSICRHKTAHLFSGCGRLGAILAGSNLEDRLARFGRSLGMAFQLTDDLLDYTSNENLLGKPVLKDLEEGNVTLPIIRLVEKADVSERRFVESVVRGRRFTAENKTEIIDLVHRYGTLEDLRTLAGRYADESRECLSDLPQSTYRDALLELPDLIVRREK